MLYLITSIRTDGAAAASVHDAVSEEYAAMAYGLEDADVYVCDVSSMNAYRKASRVTLDEVPVTDIAASSEL